MELMHPSLLELDCLLDQYDELDTHGCVHHLVEMVNVVEAILIAHLLPQSPLTALNPQLIH